MSKIKLSKEFIRNTVKLALNEDLYPFGDITSGLIKNDKIINVKLISNQNAVIGGLLFMKQAFELIDNKIKFYLNELTGAKPVITVGRNYPFNESYSHVLGYVAYASKEDLSSNEIINERHVPGLRVGKNGLEKTFETKLIGTNTIQRFEVNAYGKRIKELEFVKGTEGKNFRTTIDQQLQKRASELVKDKSGAVCVMDIYTGEVVTMVSSPTFDQNKFVHGISSKDW